MVSGRTHSQFLMLPGLLRDKNIVCVSGKPVGRRICEINTRSVLPLGVHRNTFQRNLCVQLQKVWCLLVCTEKHMTCPHMIPDSFPPQDQWAAN
eukprot:431436-Pelagomonas_calceolata.AAC.1